MKNKGVEYLTWEGKIRNRTDLTAFLTHLTKPSKKLSDIRKEIKNKNSIEELQQKIYEYSVDTLIQILIDQKLLGNNNRTIKSNIPVVCFQEVPWNLLQEIESEVWKEFNDKKHVLRYCGVGLSFHKFFLYEQGARPVIYDRRYDFLKGRRKYTQPTMKLITNERRDIQRNITMSENYNWDTNLEKLHSKMLEIKFIERIMKLDDTIYTLDIEMLKNEIIDLAVWWYEYIIELKYGKDLDLNTKNTMQNNINKIKMGTFFKPKENKSITYSLVFEQHKLIWTLFEYLNMLNIDNKDITYKQVKENATVYLDNYFSYRSIKIEEEEVIWKLVEFELRKKNKYVDQKIIDFTFEREWRKKYDLKFSLEALSKESQELLLIFPNKSILEYFKNKISKIEELKCLHNIQKYNENEEKTGIAYIILDEYSSLNREKLTSHFITKVGELMRKEGIAEEKILRVLDNL